MAKKQKSKKLDQQLLVEGKDDRHVIWALCGRYGIERNFSVEIPINKNKQKNEEDQDEDGGFETLVEGLLENLNEENLRTLGIVVDANSNIQGRWESVMNKLKTFGYTNIPKKPPAEGWIHTQEYCPKVGLWLMPNNQSTGMLEDFARSLIPNDDPLLLKAEAILQEIESENLNCYSLTHRPKAFIHTWLAWQKKPGRPMGQAITARVLGKSSEIAPQFHHWLTDLFR